MRKFVYILVLFACLSSMCSFAMADSTAVVETESNSFVSERSFDSERLNKAKENPDFHYDLNRKLEEPSILDKILYRIIAFLLKIFFNPTGSAEGIIFYVICIALVIVLILIIMRMNSIGIFSRRNARDGNGLDFSEFTVKST